jgi:glycosyltransferase EpsE
MLDDVRATHVTVIMGAYNCADTLDDALDSVAAQSYPYWDIVVCDDGSTDETPAKLAQWADRLGDRMQVLTNSTNRKLSYTLNRCLEHARGDLIARMDGDDLSVKDRFERQVEMLDADDSLHLVGTAMRRFDEAGLADVVKAPETPTRASLRRGAPFCHATVMVRRDVYIRLGGYADDPRVERVEDLDLWFRFFAMGFTGKNINDPLYLVRENLAAIRRRTLRNRINVFRTMVRGYRMLGYPWRWYVGPLVALGKALVPARAAAAYRRLQKWRGSEYTP